MTSRQMLEQAVARVRGGMGSFLKLVIALYCAALATAGLVGAWLILRWLLGAVRSIVV